MPPSAGSPPRVEALDLLRLVAVLGVVLYHFGFWGPASHGVASASLPCGSAVPSGSPAAWWLRPAADLLTRWR